jgi:hypothetical protein
MKKSYLAAAAESVFAAEVSAAGAIVESVVAGATVVVLSAGFTSSVLESPLLQDTRAAIASTLKSFFMFFLICLNN